MSVDAATVRRIAHLARIAVTEAEVPHLQGELNAMLAFVEQLSEVNVEGVEPMTSVTPMEMKKRADVVNDGEIADDIVSERAGDPGSFLSGAEGRRVDSVSRFEERVERRSPMCMLCDDEKAYAGLHELSRRDGAAGQGRRSRQGDGRRARPAGGRRQGARQADDPANDKTLSPFFCSPVDK